MAFSLRVEIIPSKLKYFGCLHVRAGTALLAALQIVVHFIVIAVLTAALGRSTRFRNDVEYVALSISVMSFIQWERFVAEVNHAPGHTQPEFLAPIPQHIELTTEPEKTMSTRISADRSRTSSYLRPSKFFLNAGEEYVAIAVTLFSLLFSIMMLVGTIYTRPYYLLPYCCIQFLDLFVTCLSVVGYYTYLPESGALARSRLWLSLINVIGGIVLLGMKAYLLSMVWLCYKFLIRYRAGSETNSGFSVAADSCVIPLKLCRKCGCCACVPVTPVTNILLPGLGSTALRITNSASSANESHIIVLLHSPSDGATLTMPSSVLASNERYMPPKYEDALAMPEDAFGPPPYSLIAGEESGCPTDTNGVLATGEPTTIFESQDAIQNPRLQPPAQENQ
ncbi:hypothetical protein D915_010167 [Fasciola hepatica]|uniref:Lysosomal-associated transmembrane protein 4A n=1 Tax=Fasciola hepatica TaxID=6192 RepID=A0A4E0RAS1_FASHE|nr:hypothetical protein D915_010167 [Fasciola hepatica]